MLHRTLVLPARKSCLLFGPRQTGKSTLVRSTLPKNAWGVDLLRHDVALRYVKDPAQFGREAEQRIVAGAHTVFIDEVQKVPALLDEVHRLIEAHGTRFLLTGSSARKLKRGGANLLAGRAATRRLHPLTIAEQGELFDLDRTLRYGSLPAVVTGDEDAARDLLQAYGATYLHEEIQAESIVRNLGGFGRFLDIAAAQCGDLLNYSAIARDAALATRTVQEYFQILEDTLIGYRLEAWRKSPRARMVAHSRFYLFDTGVTNALNRRLGAELDQAQRGRLFEQLVVLETMRLLDYEEPEARLFFWRTNVGTEVDLLIELHGRLRLAVEIEYKKRVVAADLRGLRSFHDAHPDVPLIAVAPVPEPFRLGEVKVLPMTDYARRLLQLVRDRRS